MPSKPRIELKIVTADSISTAKIVAPHVTQAMYDAAYDLVHTMGTGKRLRWPRKKPAARKKARAATR